MKKMPLIGILIIPILLPHLSFAQINTEKLRKADFKGIEKQIDLALSWYSGNTELVRIDTGFDIYYSKGKNEAFLVTDLQYGEKSGDKFISKGFAHLRGGRQVKDWMTLEIFAQKEFNKFILLKDRQLAGTGIRLPLLTKGTIENSNFDMSLGLGFMGEFEDYDKPDDDGLKKKDTELIKSTNYLSLNWGLNERMTLGMVSYFQFDPSETDNYRILSDITLTSKITKVLEFETSLNYRHDNQPPETIENYDLYIKNGFSFNF